MGGCRRIGIIDLTGVTENVVKIEIFSQVALWIGSINTLSAGADESRGVGPKPFPPLITVWHAFVQLESPGMSKLLTRLILVTTIAVGSSLTSGCQMLVPPFGMGTKMFYWAAKDAFIWSNFWGTTPLIPVTPYFSEQVESTYWEEERYDGIPVLDPVEGENAPIFCLDAPSPDEVVRALPNQTSGGVEFLAETSRNNVRMTVDLMVDRLDECRFYPLVGPARLHHCHYKCTVFFKETKRSYWPVPFTHEEDRQEVVYIDHDHLIRCAGPTIE